MRRLIDITGETFHFLKVLGFSHIGSRRKSYWDCECTRCGKIVTLRKDSFIYPYSKTKSCGCWHVEESKHRPRNPETGRYSKEST